MISIENGRVYTKGKLVSKNILIVDGRIKNVTNERIRADERVNAKGMIVLPGIIDPHVHFREPGLTHKEDFRTGSFAAAAGGVTSVLDMPNTKPPTLTNDLLSEKRELAKKSVVNFGFHFGSSTENIREIKKAKRIPSVKIFMDASTGNMLIEDEKFVRKIMAASRMNTMHAEGENLKRAIEMAKSLKKKSYFCHVSLKEELEYLKEKGVGNVFAEVTPHHLFLTEKDKSNFVNMKPVLKKDSDRRSLWEALREGTIDTIGSDHAPHTIEEKGSGNPPFGVPGIETRVPLMLDAVNKGRLTMKRLVETMCANPAKIFKIKGKGFIERGKDADLAIIDMKLRKRVRNDQLFTKCGWSPFNGWELKGWPVKTIVNGKVVFENGDVSGKIKGRELEYG